MIIDAKDSIVGRVASVAAKRALLGEEVHVVNAEQAVVSGNRAVVLEKFRHARFGRTQFRKGPFISRQPHLLLRRMIRGMLPWDRAKGREAFKRVKCHIGIPKEFEGKSELVKGAALQKMPHRKYVRIQEISTFLGGKP